MSSLNWDSKKRVLEAFNFKKPDRIPIFDSFWDEFAAICRFELGLPSDTVLSDYFKIDIYMTTLDESPFSAKARLISETDTDCVRLDGWGCTQRVSRSGYFSEEIETSLKNPSDLEKMEFESPEDDSRYAGFVEKARVEKAKGKCVFGKIGGPFLRSSFIRGKKDFLMDIAGDPEFAKEIAGRVAAFLTGLGLQELKRAELYDTGIWIYDDMAYNSGPLMSPQSFENIFLPLYRKMTADLKAAGAKRVFLHSDGNISPLLDMLIDAGIDGINPVEPRSGMSIPKLKAKYGNKLIFIGGMCNSEVLINGPESRIVSQALDIIEAASDGGIVIGMHSVGPDVPVGNYLAYHDTVMERG